MDIKTIKFRPLRRINKSNQIVVASYQSWYKLATANYGKFNLIINQEYQTFHKQELVYNFRGENLFFFDKRPKDIIDTSGKKYDEYKHLIRLGHPVKIADHHYMGRVTDCMGTPFFSHLTQDYIAEHYKDMDEFIPLTVGTVCEWYGWWLIQLHNAKILDA